MNRFVKGLMRDNLRKQHKWNLFQRGSCQRWLSLHLIWAFSQAVPVNLNVRLSGQNPCTILSE